ncbi:TIGR02302 family protein [Pseudooceanicola aestuarii]|uniref:TIGR02302 family protein n=1 Tax=Pseudooceanicola aestuarii TaxID=2697319 RepID=UPI0013D504FE|nr:TIGR02302 family protein [Pseudooceanicola aestuarii]
MPEQTQFAEILRRLRLPLFLTRTGMLAERLARCFWPLWSLSLVVLALLMLGVQDASSVELVWGLGALILAAAIVFVVRGARRFRWPRRVEALKRLDASLKGSPLQALADAPAIGGADAGSAELWRAHQARMAERARQARPVEPDLKLATRDPFGLRYVALLLFMVALLFGSFLRVGSVRDMAPGGGAALASGPTWEGWIAPPPHTGLPVLYLADITGDILTAPQGSDVTLRLYGGDDLSVEESVSGRIGDLSPTDQAQDFTLAQDGRLAIDGPGGRAWDVRLTPDAVPDVSAVEPPRASARGEMTLPFEAEDDYGVTAGEAVITLALDRVDRRHGLALAPEPREALRIPLPMPIAGDRTAFRETLVEDFSKHPWANLPVTIELSVRDAADQTGQAEALTTDLAARRFFDPVAAALVEMRRDLLWNRDNARRVAQVLKAMTWRPEGLFRDETAYLRLRVLMRRIDALATFTTLDDDQLGEIAEALWDLALLLEDGDVDDARERMERAQDRLSEAMKRGASDAEIARLMQDLRDATQDYMRQLSRQQAEDAEGDPDQQPMDMENAMRMNQDDLQRMMDRIQELMEEGRMAEAQQALEELQQLMENMQVTQGGPGGPQSPGEQAMEELNETLREQQGLSDEAFRDLQEQFNPDGEQRGQSSQNQGRSGGAGQGQQHSGQQGNQQGEGQGQGRNSEQQGRGDGRARSGDREGGQGDDLARRQQELRQELERQRGSLPGAGTEPGARARQSLEDADRAMRGAEQALRDGDLAEAIDQQSRAMEALRQGMRDIGEAVAEQERQMRGQQGQAQNEAGGQRNDPLGRNSGSTGSTGNEAEMLQGEDVYRRAQDLLDEIRRRSGEGTRPDVERDYLKRLLDRF